MNQALYILIIDNILNLVYSVIKGQLIRFQELKWL